ncbi:MAG: dihydroorotase [Saprospiraceae bacterium]|nr:dihydroorotase [Saprospiraceae bacterium]
MQINTIVKNVQIVNEGRVFDGDVHIKGDRFYRIGRDLSDPHAVIAEGNQLFLLPGCIDDQVHFREPGLTNKADIFHESRAAAAGGVTSFMEMPNTKPNTLTKELLEEKYAIASKSSAVNYSFFMGVSLENYDEIMSIDYNQTCGIKIFMGSSTGGMLVDDPLVLERIFANANALIATHCEDEKIIRDNAIKFKERYGQQLPIFEHPSIRSREACFNSSNFAVELAKKHNTRLHILHISTEEELDLFRSEIPLDQKRITSEVCVHHMFFDEGDYAALGNLIKCNPAIKKRSDRIALRKALKEGVLDVVATDHAPHTYDEKMQTYLEAPAGLPLIQHPLLLMLTMAKEENWDLPFIVQKMAHAPAQCFQIKERGFIREGYFADFILLDLNSQTLVRKEELFYKCKWSPLEGKLLTGKICSTWVNGHMIYDGHKISDRSSAQRLSFDR